MLVGKNRSEFVTVHVFNVAIGVPRLKGYIVHGAVGDQDEDQSLSVGFDS